MKQTNGSPSTPRCQRLAAPLPRAESHIRNLQNVLSSLNRYLESGGPLAIETMHGEAVHQNEIVFRVADWDAFVRVLEPTALLMLDPSESAPPSEAGDGTAR